MLRSIMGAKNGTAYRLYGLCVPEKIVTDAC